MKIKVIQQKSLSPNLFGYIDDATLHFKHIDAIFNEIKDEYE